MHCPLAMKREEIVRYRTSVGSMSIKFMTVGLIASTSWFAYQLHARGRMPWQHGNGAEIAESLVRKRERS